MYIATKSDRNYGILVWKQMASNSQKMADFKAESL